MLSPATDLVRLLPEPSYLLINTRILAANQAAGALSGVGLRELVGCDLTSLVADGDKLRQYLLLCARSKQLVPGGAQWLSQDGSASDIRCDGAVLVPRLGDQDPVVFLRCRPRAEATDHFHLLNQKIAELSQEILQRRKAEVARDDLLRREQAARLQAEEESRLKDEFLATLSHELRTPLNSILLWAHVLQQKGLPSEAVEGLVVIERNARAQTKLVEDLLDMSRVGVGKVRLEVQTVNLITVIESALEAVQPAAEAKRLRLQVTLDTWAGAIKGDPNRLLQVFWNLLSNAVKFSAKGGRIQVLLERIESRVEVTVSDTGEGIDREFLPHVFDRFRQADASTSRRHGGLGLGLSIVRHLTELHGGSVRASSAGPGLGATFTVTLPISAVQDTADLPPLPAAPSEGLPTVTRARVTALSGVNILVVDDDVDSREIIAALLGAAGAQVATAASAGEALEVLAQAVPDVLISDLGMPVEDGYQLVRKVRQLPLNRGGDLPAIALSAFARSSDRTRAMLAGFQLHLSKPVDAAELSAAVESVTKRRR